MSPTSWTLPSHVTLLSGFMPERRGVIARTDTIGPEMPLLRESFAARGYETVGIFSGPFLPRTAPRPSALPRHQSILAGMARRVARPDAGRFVPRGARISGRPGGAQGAASHPPPEPQVPTRAFSSPHAARNAVAAPMSVTVSSRQGAGSAQHSASAGSGSGAQTPGVHGIPGKGQGSPLGSQYAPR